MARPGFELCEVLSVFDAHLEISLFFDTVSDCDETSVRISEISIRVQRFENRVNWTSYVKVMRVYVI